MWERFPPRMRRIVTSALDEAGRRGHESAAPEHLLLAILADPQSGGAIVLRQCGLDLDRLTRQIEIIAPASGNPQRRAERFDSSAMHLLDVAAGESDRLGDRHIGTEHLAIAIARLDDLPAGQMLRDMGLTPQSAEQAAAHWSKSGMVRPDPPSSKKRGLLQKILHTPRLAWSVYVRKSLGHPKFVTDPYPLYDWLRRRAPVRKDPLAPVWVLTRYDDVVHILRDPRFRKDPYSAERLPKIVSDQLAARGQSPHVSFGSVSMLFLDPPDHTRVRSQFTRAFTPATLAALRPRIELIASKRLDRVESSGRIDLIAELAYPLPVIVIAELLGFPAEDFEKFKRWSDDMTATLALNATPAAQLRGAEARDQVRQYFDGLIPTLRQRPDDSLIGRLLKTSTEPDSLNLEEIFTNSVLLLAAGHETTTNLIGNGVLALMRHRDQWDDLVRDPLLIESAVEEMLRYDTPAQWASRVAGEDIEMAGQAIPSGSIVLGSLGSANRDPAKFPDPDLFDIRRTENKHLAFGSGVHFCLGAALARMEAQIALRLLVQRFPGMRLEKTRLQWLTGLTFRGVKSLPLLLRPA